MSATLRAQLPRCCAQGGVELGVVGSQLRTLKWPQPHTSFRSRSDQPSRAPLLLLAAVAMGYGCCCHHGTGDTEADTARGRADGNTIYPTLQVKEGGKRELRSQGWLAHPLLLRPRTYHKCGCPTLRVFRRVGISTSSSFTVSQKIQRLSF